MQFKQPDIMPLANLATLFSAAGSSSMQPFFFFFCRSMWRCDVHMDITQKGCRPDHGTMRFLSLVSQTQKRFTAACGTWPVQPGTTVVLVRYCSHVPYCSCCLCGKCCTYLDSLQKVSPASCILQKHVQTGFPSGTCVVTKTRQALFTKPL